MKIAWDVLAQSYALVAKLPKLISLIEQPVKHHAFSIYSQLKHYWTCEEEMVWVTFWNDPKVMQYQTWCRSFKKELKKVTRLLENREILPFQFRQFFHQTQKNFQKTIISPWYYERQLKKLAKKIEESSLPQIFSDSCYESCARLRLMLQENTELSLHYFSQDLFHLIVKSSAGKLLHTDALSLLNYYQNLVPASAHESIAQTIKDLFFHQPEEPLEFKFIGQAKKAEWQKTCKQALLTCKRQFELLCREDKSKQEHSVFSDSFPVAMSLGMQKAWGITKKYPVKTFAYIGLTFGVSYYNITQWDQSNNISLISNNHYLPSIEIASLAIPILLSLKIPEIRSSMSYKKILPAFMGVISWNMFKCNAATLSPLTFAANYLIANNIFDVGTELMPNVGKSPTISISAAGDVNNDNLDDIVIGVVPNYLTPGKGTANVIYGSESTLLANTNLGSIGEVGGGLVLESETTSNTQFLGVSVSGKMDVNGDGYSDVVVGESTNSGIAGSAHVVLGDESSLLPSMMNPSSLNGNNGFTLEGKYNGSSNGEGYAIVSAVGDLNGDQLDDLAIAGSSSTTPGVEGYIVFGRSHFQPIINTEMLNGTNGFTILGKFLNSLSRAGDMNGDGLEDFIAGASLIYPGGGAYIVLGSKHFQSSFNLTLVNGLNGSLLKGAKANDLTGYSVAGGCDLNGDGLADAIIGAPGANVVYVVFGRKNFPATLYLADLIASNGLVLQGVNEGDLTGESVSCAGDVNGDGCDDIIIGAPTFLLSSSPGKAYVFFGCQKNSPGLFNLTNLDGAKGFPIEGRTYAEADCESCESSDHLGSLVSGAGDLNGDGYNDLMIYAPGANQGNGAIYVLDAAKLAAYQPSSTSNSQNKTDEIIIICVSVVAGISFLAGMIKGIIFCIERKRRKEFAIRFHERQAAQKKHQEILETQQQLRESQETQKRLKKEIEEQKAFSERHESRELAKSLMEKGKIYDALTLYFISSREGDEISKQKLKDLSEKVLELLYKAIFLDDAEAKFLLAEMFLDGADGLPQSDTEAFKLFLIAADKDHPGAQYMVGLCNEQGRVGDICEAIKWYRKAAARGHMQAGQALDRLQKLDKFTDSKKKNALNVALALTIEYKDVKKNEVIGQGGFGKVYKGIYQDNVVAIKELLPERIDERGLRDFLKEMETMAVLRFPQIVQLWGVYVNPNFGIVMEYMSKGPLDKVLRKSGSIPWETRFKIATAIIKGVKYLHEKNIIHRDIKSANILLDEHMNAKLSDFGLAKIKTNTATSISGAEVVGSYLWMAPELLKIESSCTKASDIYAVGIVFWEIAARKMPFINVVKDIPGHMIHMAMRQHVAEKNEREAIPPETPIKFSSLIKFCWNERPENRPPAKEVLKELRSLEMAGVSLSM